MNYYCKKKPVLTTVRSTNPQKKFRIPVLWRNENKEYSDIR